MFHRLNGEWFFWSTVSGEWQKSAHDDVSAQDRFEKMNANA
jgi:hypothetical protein